MQLKSALEQLIEHKEVFPVCEPAADLFQLLNFQGGSDFHPEEDMHHAMDLASKAAWSAATKQLLTERQMVRTNTQRLVARAITCVLLLSLRD